MVQFILLKENLQLEVTKGATLMAAQSFLQVDPNSTKAQEEVMQSGDLRGTRNANKIEDRMDPNQRSPHQGISCLQCTKKKPFTI